MKQFITNLTTRLAKWHNTNMQANRTQQLLQPAVATDNLKFEICNLKLFRRGFLSLFLLFVLATGNVWGATVTTWTWTAKSGDLGSASGTKELNGKSWTITRGNASYTGFNSNYIQLGSKASPEGQWSLSTSEFSAYTITGISITAYTGGTATYEISAGGSSKKSGSLGTSASPIYSVSDLSTSGAITISFNASKQAMYIKSISVTYIDDCTEPSAELSYTSGSCLTNVAFDLDGLKTGGNGGAVTYTCATSGVTISDNSATFSKEGTYTFTATQAKNGNVCAGSATFTVTASLPTYTITWLVDNVATTEGEPTTSVKQGSKITKLPTTPTVPNGCGEKVFMGWSENNIGTTPGGKPDDLFTTAPTTAITSNKTYYAVFATKTTSGGVTSTMTYGFETTDDATKWTISNLATYNAAKNSGTNSGSTSSNAAAYILTKSAYVVSNVTFYASRTTNNTSSSSWVISTSTDGSTWTQVASNSATSMDKGSWTKYSTDITSTDAVYVKIAYSGSTAIRLIDDISLTVSTSTTTYSDYITTCEECDAPTTELSLTGETALSLGEDGATITVTAAGGNGGEITFACSDASVTVTKLTSTTASVKFTDSGKFTLTAKQAKNGTTCSQSASLVVNVSATPTINISQSGALNVTIPCGTGTKNQTVTLSGYNLTEGIKVTSSNSAITVSNAANGTYGSLATYAASNKKVNTPLYIQITAPAESTTAISGTLTFSSSGATSQTLTVNATVTCQQYTLTFNANGGSNAPAAQKCYGGSPVTLPNQGSMVAPTNKVFVGWNTDKNATTALESYTMPTEDDVLYAIWRAADYKISCGDVSISTQVGKTGNANVAITLNDETSVTVGDPFGTNASMFQANVSGGILSVTFNGSTSEGNYSAKVTLTGAHGQTCTVNITAEVKNLAVIKWNSKAISNFCYDEGINDTIPLSSPLYYSAGTLMTTNSFDACVTLTDVSLGKTVSVTCKATEQTATKPAYVIILKENLTLGHTYRLDFNNTANLTDATGLQYANTSSTFTVENCLTATVYPPCPVTENSFTAKWKNEYCTSGQSLNVYQKSETVIASTDFTKITVKDFSKKGESVWASAKNGSVNSVDETYGFPLVNSDAPDKGFVYSPIFGNWKSDIDEDDEIVVEITCWNRYTTTLELNVSVVENYGTSGDWPTYKSVMYDNTSEKTHVIKYDTSKVAATTKSFVLKGVSSGDKLFIGKNTAKSSQYLTKVVIKTQSNVSLTNYPTTVDCSKDSYEVTGLTAGKTYYYTLGNGTEQKVTTRSGEPELAFDLGKLNIQSTDGVCATGVVDVVGENVSACDVNVSLDGTNKEMFTLDTSNLTYDVTTGTVGGSVSVEFCPGTARGTKTAKLTITAGGVTNTIDIEGTSCSSFSPSSTDVGSTYAVANLGTTMSGTVSVTDLSGENKLNNPGFETDATTGWTSTQMSDHAFTVELNTKEKHGGNNSVKVTGNGDNWKLAYKQNISALFSNNLSLEGDYALSFYVKVTASEEFYYGLADEKGNLVTKTKTYKAVSYTGQWVQLSASFTELSGNYILFIGRRTTSEEVLYIDDISLFQTSAGSTEGFSYNGTTATMENLWPGHNYSYIITNEKTKCEYGPFTFTTKDSTITPTITADPITITCQTGKSATGIIAVGTEWITSTVSVSGSCDNFSVNTNSLKSTGGSLIVTFTPGADVAGVTFECTLTLSGTGSTGNGSESVSKTVKITGVVSAGGDPSAPLIEVVDIDTTMMAVEHNITGVDSVEIKLNREKDASEIKQNVGYDIFFSKYYEASQTVKLWAIFNPTNDTIDLTDTYVWLGETEWHPKNTFCSLQYLGRVKGKICPQEEIIVYASDGNGKTATGTVIGCAATKTDMSGWFGLEPQGNTALSFDGNDALTLVRAETNKHYTGKTYKTNELKINKYKKLDGEGDTTIYSWRYIAMPHYRKVDNSGVADQTHVTVGDSVRFQMLDLIGARKSSNQPDNSKCEYPVFSSEQHGDEEGWNSQTGKDMNGNNYPNPTGEYDVLSTNRCLLVRSKEVKSGSDAITKNQGDFYTLGTEWQGANVPEKGTLEDKGEVSCENFAYVGGFDYASYYNSYTSLSGDEYHFGLQLVDSTYKTNDFKTLTDYTCQKLLIECVVYDTIGGIGVRTVKASTEYKVPIIVNKVTTTADKTIFNYSTDTCKECDVVILANKRLSHNDDSQWHQFRDMKVFPGGNFYIGTDKNFTLRNLEMQAKNDTVSYAKIDGSLTVTGDLVHEKRIDSKNWYCFSLPYACNLAAVRQLNGKSLGEYNKDWWIQYYDGTERAEKGTWNEAGTGYNGASYWKTFVGTETLEANVAYLIGIGGINESKVRYKTIYFPPSVQEDIYTEDKDDVKPVSVEAHVGASVTNGHENDRGWNFIGNPYISIFNQSSNNNGVNSTDKLFFGHWNGTDYDTKSKIYVNVPDGKGKYVQNEASSIQLYPFKGYFIQVAGAADTELYFAKGQRELKVAEAPSSELHADVILQIADAAGNNDVTGILVDEDYTDSYEVARDLTKMGSTTQDGPQLWTYITDGTRQRLAFNALPAASAKRIPLSIYAPKAGDYKLSINQMQSDLSGVTAVTLYYGETAVANLLDGDFTITTNRRATDNGYSITVERVAQITTPINNNLSDAAAPIVVLNNGQVSVEQLPASGNLMVVDAVGRQIWSHALDGSTTCSLQHLPAGVYMIVVDGNNQRYLLRTIVK